MNKEKGIAVKRVTITGVSNAVPLHDKHNLLGASMLDAQGKGQPSDYVRIRVKDGNSSLQ